MDHSQPLAKPFAPLTIGARTFASNVIQGPLAGISCAPFRKLLWQHSQPAYTCTEMLSAYDLAHHEEQPKRYVYRDPIEGPLCYQLSGNHPDYLKQATERVTNAGADIIDLNCGCPVHKIRNKTAGSKLLQQPDLLYQLLRAIKQNTSVPVTVKIRVSAPVGDHSTFDVISAVESAGVDAIIVHGRHWSQRYDVAASLDAIKEIVELASVPVIANGDIADLPSLLTMFEQTGCKGVMIARATVGDPWLIQRLQQEYQHGSALAPTLTAVKSAFIAHVEDLVALEGERNAVLQSRKLAQYYAKHFPERAVDFMMRANELKEFSELKAHIAAL